MKKSIALILLFAALFLISCQQKGGSNVSAKDSTNVEVLDTIAPIQTSTVIPDSAAIAACQDSLTQAQ